MSAFNPPAFNPLIEQLSSPPVPSVAVWARAYGGSEGPLIDLSQAAPGYSPHPEMLSFLGQAASSADFTRYGPIEGEPELRRVYGQHVSEIYGAAVGSENIHITSGCNQAFVCAAMAVAGPGDTVLMTEPFYFNHETTLAMMGVGTAFAPCRAENGFLPDIGDLEAAMTPEVRALTLVSPNNPTGAIYPPSLLEAIFTLCRRRGIWLILDETYRDFLPRAGEQPHGLFKFEGWEENLISLYSFSKSFCIPGHRLGAVTAGAKAVEQIAKIMDNLQICAPRAAQAAVAGALPVLADWREENRQEIGQRAVVLREVMEKVNGWQIKASGAYFAFVRHPFQGKGSTEVAEQLARKAGIISIPGAYFGDGQQDYLRFAFANADGPTIARLGERLKNFSLS